MTARALVGKCFKLIESLDPVVWTLHECFCHFFLDKK